MGARKKGDTSPRRRVVRQVCMTEETAEMLSRVAEAQYNGHVSHALLGLVNKPLKKAYERIAS